MLIKDISPFVRQTLVMSLNTKNEYEVSNELCTYDSRLFYITDGCGEMIIENKHYFLKPGCAVLFISGTKYTWKVNNIDFITVNFDYTQDFSHI